MPRARGGKRGGGASASAAAPATPRRRKIHDLDAMPTLSPLKSDDAERPGLPCLKCAKRMIIDNKSKSSTDVEKTADDSENGKVRISAVACRHGGRKCEHCSDTKKPCKPIPDCPNPNVKPGDVANPFANDHRNGAKQVLRRCLAMVKVGAVTSEHQAKALSDQQLLSACLEGRASWPKSMQAADDSDFDDDTEDTTEDSVTVGDA